MHTRHHMPRNFPPRYPQISFCYILHGILEAQVFKQIKAPDSLHAMSKEGLPAWRFEKQLIPMLSHLSPPTPLVSNPGSVQTS